MTDTNQKQLGNTPWRIAYVLRGKMNADDCRTILNGCLKDSPFNPALFAGPPPSKASAKSTKKTAKKAPGKPLTP